MTAFQMPGSHLWKGDTANTSVPRSVLEQDFWEAVLQHCALSQVQCLKDMEEDREWDGRVWFKSLVGFSCKEKLRELGWFSL